MIPTTPEALLNFVSKLRPQADGCWEWAAGHSTAGYGYWRHQCVHRVTYELFVGPIPEGYEMDHFVCQNKGCCNPLHVEPVPVEGRENTRRYRASITHCPHGHEFTKTNTSYTKLGHRVCRACRREYYVRIQVEQPERHEAVRDKRRLRYQETGT